LAVVGQIVCPDPVLGMVQARTKQLVGQSMAYPPGGRLIAGSLVMDEAFLKGLDDASDLVILGSLRMPRAVSNDLLAQKLGKLYVTGGIRVHEENADAIQARLSNGARKMTVIPAGYALVEKPLVLDDTVLEALPASKLFCLERVEIEAATSSEILDERLAEIVAKDLLLCPTGLRGVMSRKCHILETQTIFYDGELWLVDGAEEVRIFGEPYRRKAEVVVMNEFSAHADRNELMSWVREFKRKPSRAFCSTSTVSSRKSIAGSSKASALAIRSLLSFSLRVRFCWNVRFRLISFGTSTGDDRASTGQVRRDMRDFMSGILRDAGFTRNRM